jgi:uncharacterized membrane protein
MANPKTVIIAYSPVGTTYKLYLPDRIRKAVLNRLLDATQGTPNRVGNIDRCRFGTEDAVREVVGEEYPDWTVQVNDERAKIQRPGDRVKWADVEQQWNQERRGYVGTVQAFKVHKTTTRGDTTPYRLSTTLASMSTEYDSYATQEDAERAAEGVLETFLLRLGFSFED